MPEIRWGAFAGAAILAPLVPAVPALPILWVLSAMEAGPMMVIPIAAVAAPVMGAPTYFLLGLPSFALALPRYGIASCWLAGLVANIASTPFVVAFFAASSGQVILGTSIVVGFGFVFAPLWGAIFSWLYGAFTRETRA